MVIFVNKSWSDGNAVDYINWEQGAPDDNDGQLCVTLNVQYGANMNTLKW